MSDEGEIELPSAEEIANLPLDSIATYAIRCALRVQPLLVAGDEATEEFKNAVVRLNHQYKVLIHDIARSTAEDVENSARSASAYAGYGDYSARAAADTIIAASITARADGADYAANAANRAVESARIAIRTTRSSITAAFTLSTISTIADHSDYTALEDYEQLKELKTKITDASESGPLGDLWHGSPPEWYLKTKKYYDKTIVEWERETALEDTSHKQSRHD